MSAKINLIGQPQSLQTDKDGVVTFRIITGPASNTAPKGLPLFKATTYLVQCSVRQYNRGRVNEQDKSELVIEGYQEPRVDENGKLYIAVIATAVASKDQQAARKLEQLCEETGRPRMSTTPPAISSAWILRQPARRWTRWKSSRPTSSGL